MTSLKTGLRAAFATFALAAVTAAPGLASAAEKKADGPRGQGTTTITITTSPPAEDAPAKPAAPAKASANDDDDSPRVVYLRDEIDDAMALRVDEELVALDKKAPGKPIELRIDSPGGGVQAGLLIYDTMKSLHSPVATTCESMCASMAAVLLVGGTPGMRTALPSSVVMIHELSGGVPAVKYSSGKNWQHLADILEDKMVTILAGYSGHSKAWMAESMKVDTFYSADEALSNRFIDRVQLPIQPTPEHGKGAPAAAPAAPTQVAPPPAPGTPTPAAPPQKYVAPPQKQHAAPRR